MLRRGVTVAIVWFCLALATVTLGAFYLTDRLPADVAQYRKATLACTGHAATLVRLPHYLGGPTLAGGKEARCTFQVQVAHRWERWSAFIPSLNAYARIDVGGHVVFDSVNRDGGSTPTLVEQLVLVDNPEAVVGPGPDQLAISIVPREGASLSTIYVGPPGQMRYLYRSRTLGVIIVPSIVATVVGTLGFCTLLLWLNLRDPALGYFGAGASFWAAHTLLSVIRFEPPLQLNPYLWWTGSYTVISALIAVFCMRFASWKKPRCEAMLGAACLLIPLLLYGAGHFGLGALADRVLRAVLIIIVGVILVAVTRAAFSHTNTSRWLMVLAVLTAFTFSVHDWLLESRGSDGDNPVYLVPFAGFIFSILVAQMLIERFTRTSEELQSLNTELENRVSQQSQELRVTMESMRQARDAAQAADAAKTRFLAIASHDLRQPAHALVLYMAALKAEPIGSSQVQLVERMGHCVSTLESMFNALLDVSRIDAGALKPRNTTFDLEGMLRQLAGEFAAQAEARGLRFVLRLPNVPALYTRTDPLLLQQILRNLLSNAVKYTREGGVLFACRVRSMRTGAGGSMNHRHWCIEVWDSGIGIREDHICRIFDEFYQVADAGDYGRSGLGLGLAIVRRLVQLLDLRVDLKTRFGRGSCFVVRVPVVGAEGASGGIQMSTTPAVRGMCVALLEDDLSTRDATKLWLQSWGCCVVEGASANELEQQLVRSRQYPDAMIVDFTLGEGRTGPGEAERLFATWKRRVPMLIVTGETSTDILASEKASCISKPASPALLMRWLTSVHKQELRAGSHASN